MKILDTHTGFIRLIPNNPINLQTKWKAGDEFIKGVQPSYQQMKEIRQRYLEDREKNADSI